MAEKVKKEKLLQYKGKPLVRNGNLIYYGDLADPFVAMLQIHDTSDFADLHLPSRVSVQILSTNEELPLKDRMKKRAEKNSFYDAINIASIWLERALEDENA